MFRKISSFNFSFLLLVFVIAGFAVPAFAARLTIVGTSDLRISLEDERVILAGTYSTLNKGDETVTQVFPVIQLGQWSWAGEPQNIDIGGQASWTIQEEFPQGMLACGDKAPCAEKDLPSVGLFPLFTTLHYQDLNGYAFSAPKLETVLLGGVTGVDLVNARSPFLQARFDLSGDGSKFRGHLEVLNLHDKPKEIVVTYFTSRELHASPKSELLELAPNAAQNTSTTLTNFSALPGSTYPVFAVLQWNENGVRNTVSAFATVLIEMPKRDDFYLTSIIVVLLLSALLILIVVRKRTRGET